MAKSIRQAGVAGSVRLRATLVLEYQAYPADYPGAKTPADMAKIDLANGSGFLKCSDEAVFDVKVVDDSQFTGREPVGRVVPYHGSQTAIQWANRAPAVGTLLYTEQTADLGQFREVVRRDLLNAKAQCQLPRIQECERLLALIDSQKR